MPKLQLGSNELWSVGLFGMGALVAGSLYQLVSIYIKQASDSYVLDPETEALQNFPTLYSLMYQLGEFRHFSESSYRDAVISADDLALRVQQISAGEIQPGPRDVADALSLQRNTSKQITKMTKKAKDMNNPRNAAQIHNLHEKVYPELQSIYNSILRLSR